MADDSLLQSLESLSIPLTHVTVGFSNMIAANHEYRSLLINRRLPEEGWNDVQIQHFLLLLATLDTNNKQTTAASSANSIVRWCGVGEREGRVYSSLVANRHFGLAHGMGRSGDLLEPQPKAVGSTVLVQLTVYLMIDALRRGSGLNSKTIAAYGIVLPMCTGMSMALVLSSLRTTTHRNLVLWSRIDQKSCLKAILSAGYECIVVPTKLRGDEVVTDLEALESLLQQHGPQTAAVISTTSCFAPRVPDLVDLIAKLCQKYEIPHVINNAYGLQSTNTSKLINRACVVGRVDAMVCSTDKNFLVPVGGAIVVACSKAVIDKVSKIYAGRASSAPIVDLFITLVSMGIAGYKRILDDRMNVVATFPDQLDGVAKKHGERLLHCPSNNISFGITLDSLSRPRRDGETEEAYLKDVSKEISKFGAMLFSRCVSGTRVISRGEVKTMGDIEFVGFGSSYESYPHSYMTAACAIGVGKNEVDEFMIRLDKTLSEYKRKMVQETKQV